MKKPLTAALAACVLFIGVLAGCAGNTAVPQSGSVSSSPGSSDGETKVKVVCATFPAYDWVRQVVGDKTGRFDITYLMGGGTDLHSFQPSVDDVAKISGADLFVYVGGESDAWAADAVKAAANPSLRTVNMLEAVGAAAVEEEVVEGMQPEAEHAGEAAHEGEGSHEEGEGPAYDEHVWLSLRNAQLLVSAIADGISALDPENAALYSANAKAYQADLAALDGRYQDAVKHAAKDTVIFADRFPFRYLVDDYSLKYFAAFVGCSAETEASFETVAFLAKKVDELGLPAVLVIEKSDEAIARTVREATNAKGQQILVMDSLQSATRAEADGGKTYLGVMEENLGTLSAALVG